MFILFLLFIIVIVMNSLFLFVFNYFNRDTTLMYFNTVFTLGNMGVLLKDIGGTQEAVLQFFQQNLQLTNLPSSLGEKIIEQLGNMIIAGCVWYILIILIKLFENEKQNHVYKYSNCFS